MLSSAAMMHATEEAIGRNVGTMGLTLLLSVNEKAGGPAGVFSQFRTPQGGSCSTNTAEKEDQASLKAPTSGLSNKVSS